MTERQLQFRVGLFVLLALAVTVMLVLHFGNLRAYWRPAYEVTIHFDSGAGMHPSMPVRRNGIAIGTVEEVAYDERTGGVLVQVEIDREHRLRADALPRLERSLLGDASIEIDGGTSSELLHGGAHLQGKLPPEPMEIVHRIERQVTGTLQTFEETSRQWKRVGENLNGLLETKHGGLGVVVERTATALEEFTQTMRTAHRAIGRIDDVLGDPRSRANLKRALDGLPAIVEDTREAIGGMKSAVTAIDENLVNLKNVTEPLGERSRSIVIRLDHTLVNLESLSAELAAFAKLAARKDGTIRRLATDPELYRNLNRSAVSLSVLLKNLEPAVRDLRIFSDKVARHPELIGVGGALRGSSGLKEPPPEQTAAEDEPTRR